MAMLNNQMVYRGYIGAISQPLGPAGGTSGFCTGGLLVVVAMWV